MKQGWRSLAAALLFGMVVGCAGPAAYLRPGFLEHPPRRVGVLPFTITYQYDRTNGQPVPEAHRIGRDLFRKTFYYAFAPYGYEDMKLADVDEKLRVGYGGAWRDAMPQALGRTLGVDAVIYGDLSRIVHLSTPLYTETSLQSSLRMVDTSTGELLWRKEVQAGDRGGALIKGGQAVDFVADQVRSFNPSVKFLRVCETAARRALADMPNPPLADPQSAQTSLTNASDRSVRLLVLPFEPKQRAWQRAATLLRSEVAAGLEEGSFELVELQRVDAALKSRGWNEGDPLPHDPSVLSEIAKALGADAYVRGTVIGWGRRFLVVESWVQTELRLQLVDATTGDTVWSEQKRNTRQAGVLKGPTGYSSVVTAPILGVRTSTLEQVASQLARTMADDLKSSPAVSVYATERRSPGAASSQSAPKSRYQNESWLGVQGSGLWARTPRTQSPQLRTRAPRDHFDRRSNAGSGAPSESGVADAS